MEINGIRGGVPIDKGGCTVRQRGCAVRQRGCAGSQSLKLIIRCGGCTNF